jgi:TPR repeat protein
MMVLEYVRGISLASLVLIVSLSGTCSADETGNETARIERCKPKLTRPLPQMTPDDLYVLGKRHELIVLAFLNGSAPKAKSNIEHSKACAELLLKAAGMRGHVEAQARLGAAFERGRWVQRDYEESLRWNKMAAANGSVDAIKNLGFAYENGLAVKKTCIARLISTCRPPSDIASRRRDT